LVERQLAYFLIPFRQAVLAIPTKLRRQLGERFDHEMVRAAKGNCTRGPGASFTLTGSGRGRFGEAGASF